MSPPHFSSRKWQGGLVSTLVHGNDKVVWCPFSHFHCFWWRIMKKLLSIAKVIAFWNLESRSNYITCKKFNRNFPNIKLKIYLLPQFCYGGLKLSCYVLRTKTKFLSSWNFDLSLRSQRWKNRVFEIISVQKIIKMATENFQNSIFPPLRGLNKILTTQEFCLVSRTVEH